MYQELNITNFRGGGSPLKRRVPEGEWNKCTMAFDSMRSSASVGDVWRSARCRRLNGIASAVISHPLPPTSESEFVDILR